MSKNMIAIIALLIVSIGMVSVRAQAFNVEAYGKLILSLDKNKHMQKLFDEYIQELVKLDENYLEFKPNGAEFDCRIDFSSEDLLENEVTINTLKPSDIKVTAALGDSLTAALGAKASNIAGLLFEYRGVSFSIGGDSNLTETITMPNILKQFAPDITGFSTGNTWLYTKAGDKLNRAVSGSEAHNIMDQVKELIFLLQTMPEIDFKNDWKLVTLFIGANDLCETCTGRVESFPENYIKYVKDALDVLQSNVPKTFVNLVSVLNIAPVREMNRNTFCTQLHKYACGCGAFPATSKDEDALNQRYLNYTMLLRDLAWSGRYDVTDQFAVVWQPFLANYTAPRDPDGQIDLTYFAPDCFHFSSKLHALGAISLWNNMLQPVGSKQDTVHFDKKILCPTKESPYLFTNRNSIGF